MQVAVFGAGAVGSLVGARLHEAGVNVRLIARPDHARQIREHGLRVEGGRDVRVVHVPASDRLEGAADLILLAVKSQDVAAACRAIARESLSATVVTLQNGVRADLEAAAVLGRDRIAGCVCYVSASYLRPGLIEVAGWGGRLLIGAPYPESRARVEGVHEVLRQALPTSVAPDFQAARWTKLIVNLPNAILVATGLPIGRAFRIPVLARLAVAAMREGAQVAQASSHPLEANARGRRFRLLALLPTPLAQALFQGRVRRQFPEQSQFGGSTQQSLQRGTTSELDYLNGEIVRAGADAGRRTPINSALLGRGQDVFRTRRLLTPEELVAGLDF
ncbi:MAG TPA: 2-dehydropantoate 2-reductase [Candidatus Limnocylindrales bacterium]|nr:2-dehydropantoate 2-reductase [Candidatus Limnocylindrales bacterium]